MKNVNILKRSRPYQENLALSVHKITVKTVEIINFILNYFYMNVLFIKYTTYYCQPILSVYSIL